MPLRRKLAMNANVPEVQGTGDELEALVMKLAGNEAFAACRGKLDTHISYVIDDLIDGTENSAQFCARFDEYFGRVRVMGNLLAKLRRDKKSLAYDELRRALSIREFVLTHEEVPLSKTTPAVILMLEPAKTFPLIKWMDEASMFETRLFAGISLSRSPWSAGIAEVSQLTRDLFKVLPGLLAYTRKIKEAGGDNGQELREAYQETLKGLPRSFDGAMPLMTTSTMRLLNTAETGGCGSTFIFPLAYLFLGKTQNEVLGLFSREEQDRVTTWQLHIPTLPLRYNQMFDNASIWFHPEEEHARWSRDLKSFVSKGVSRGYGAAFVCDSASLHVREAYTGTKHSIMINGESCKNQEASSRHGLCVYVDHRDQHIQALKAGGILPKDWQPIR